jgi:HSP20 family molecular chaperone IbpA
MKQRTIAQRAFNQQVGYPSNRYQLIDNDEKFQLTVDVPGVKEEDIDIKLDDGQLTVRGQRRAVTEFSRFSSKFSQSFYLDPTVDVDSFTATLTDGVLVVSASKDLSKLEENVRRIPITPLEDIVGEENVYEGTDKSVEDKTGKEHDIPVDSNRTDAENNIPDNSNNE